MTNKVEAMTETISQMSRPEKRRLWKEAKRAERYEKSKFLDLNWGYLPSKIRPNKYVPHISKKQIGKYS